MSEYRGISNKSMQFRKFKCALKGRTNNVKSVIWFTVLFSMYTHPKTNFRVFYYWDKHKKFVTFFLFDSSLFRIAMFCYSTAIVLFFTSICIFVSSLSFKIDPFEYPKYQRVCNTPQKIKWRPLYRKEKKWCIHSFFCCFVKPQQLHRFAWFR